MNIESFCNHFNHMFPPDKIAKPNLLYGIKFTRRFFDPCPNVPGMASIKKQKLLNLAFSCLEKDESYLEIGTYLGKSLISAMLGNTPHPVFACDNFSEFGPVNSYEKLMHNLRTYGLIEKVIFFNDNFLNILTPTKITNSPGLYFYDGAHDETSQYNGIKYVEPLLADEAIVVVDDWRFAPDSQSYAKVGTQKAVAESSNHWQLLYELPARYNSDSTLWWNGIAVYGFNRSNHGP